MADVLSKSSVFPSCGPQFCVQGSPKSLDQKVAIAGFCHVRSSPPAMRPLRASLGSDFRGTKVIGWEERKKPVKVLKVVTAQMNLRLGNRMKWWELSVACPLSVSSEMATSSALLPVTGGTRLDSTRSHPSKLHAFSDRRLLLNFPQKNGQLNARRRMSVCAEYNGGSRGGSGDFLAGFLVGGALFGTLAYVFAPQIRRSILNEDEYGFRRAKRPIYYDEGLEKTRQTLNAKISQLNSAIDNVSSRLRGGSNAVAEPIETDSEVEAAM